jgi:hypothetical protein
MAASADFTIQLRKTMSDITPDDNLVATNSFITFLESKISDGDLLETKSLLLAALDPGHGRRRATGNI